MNNAEQLDKLYQMRLKAKQVENTNLFIVNSAMSE